MARPLLGDDQLWLLDRLYELAGPRPELVDQALQEVGDDDGPGSVEELVEFILDEHVERGSGRAETIAVELRRSWEEHKEKAAA